MTDRPTHHASFTIERDLPHPPSRVFGAVSTLEAKSHWFADRYDEPAERERGSRELMDALEAALAADAAAVTR